MDVDPALEHAFVGGQRRAHFGALIDGFEARGAAMARAEPDAAAEHAYGPHARQRFEWWPADPAHAARGVFVYWHAGYWQFRDKALFRWIAPPLRRHGWHVVLPNYPLCPTVSMPQLLDAARAAPAPLRSAAVERGAAGLPWVLAGHSAGAHLALDQLRSMRLRENASAAAVAVRGLLAVSGVYDLVPLVSTSLNERLALDTATATAVSSPATLEPAVADGCDAWWAVGADETPAFVAQNAELARRWRAAGGTERVDVVARCDHFTLLSALFDAAGPRHAALLQWLDGVADGARAGAVADGAADTTRRAFGADPDPR